MKSKAKIVLTRALLGMVTLIIVAGAIMKLIGLPQLVEIYSKIGLLQYLKILGIVELVFVALFLWRPTMKIGFLLLTGYFGGAMAVELSHGTFFIAPGTILSLVWMAAYLRDVSLFSSLPKRAEIATHNKGKIISQQQG
jgi:hypothetical protein